MNTKRGWHTMSPVMGLLVWLGLMTNPGLGAGEVSVAIESVRPDKIIKEWKELNDPVMATGYLYNMNMLNIMTKDEFAATR